MVVKSYKFRREIFKRNNAVHSRNKFLFLNIEPNHLENQKWDFKTNATVYSTIVD